MLIVTKLDRLGHNAMDVRAAVEQLAADCVRVRCLALGGVELLSARRRGTDQPGRQVDHERAERGC